MRRVNKASFFVLIFFSFPQPLGFDIAANQTLYCCVVLADACSSASIFSQENQKYPCCMLHAAGSLSSSTAEGERERERERVIVKQPCRLSDFAKMLISTCVSLEICQKGVDSVLVILSRTDETGRTFG